MKLKRGVLVILFLCAPGLVCGESAAAHMPLTQTRQHSAAVTKARHTVALARKAGPAIATTAAPAHGQAASRDKPLVATAGSLSAAEKLEAVHAVPGNTRWTHTSAREGSLGGPRAPGPGRLGATSMAPAAQKAVINGTEMHRKF